MFYVDYDWLTAYDINGNDVTGQPASYPFSDPALYHSRFDLNDPIRFERLSNVGAVRARVNYATRTRNGAAAALEIFNISEYRNSNHVSGLGYLPRWLSRRTR